MKITPTNFIQLPLDGIATNLEITVNSFQLFPSSIEVGWSISGDGICRTGILTLPQSIVDSWGTDDTVVKDYVLAQLNLSEDTSPDPAPPQSTEPDVNNP